MANKLKLIGIGGTTASGKDTVGQILKDYHGWLFVSMTDSLRKELTRRGIVITRENQRKLSAEWRREAGKSVLIDKAVEAYGSEAKKYEGLVLASLRHPAEADKVHELGGLVIWTDADPKIRYSRVVSRDRGTEDRVTFEEFLAEEKAQMQHSGDDATLNLAGVKARADIFLENNSDDIEIFKNQLEKALNNLL